MDWILVISALVLICFGTIIDIISVNTKNLRSTDAAFLGYAGGLCTGIGWTLVLNF